MHETKRLALPVLRDASIEKMRIRATKNGRLENQTQSHGSIAAQQQNYEENRSNHKTIQTGGG
jgi:hypothetical protein